MSSRHPVSLSSEPYRPLSVCHMTRISLLTVRHVTRISLLTVRHMSHVDSPSRQHWKYDPRTQSERRRSGHVIIRTPEATGTTAYTRAVSATRRDARGAEEWWAIPSGGRSRRVGEREELFIGAWSRQGLQRSSDWSVGGRNLRSQWGRRVSDQLNRLRGGGGVAAEMVL